MLQPSARRVALFVGLGALACGGGLGRPSAPPERIVLLVIDTLRADALSCCGGTEPTPAIDALAARGQVFEDALGSFYQTTMSMGALFTGRTPSFESGDEGQPLSRTRATWCGLARLAGPAEATCIPASVATLGEVLRAAGYWTIGVTSNSLLFEPFGLERGFDDWTEVGARAAPLQPLSSEQRAALHRSRAAPEVDRAVDRALGRRPRDRFFLYVHYMDVHDYALAAGRPAYLRAVADVDRAIGALLDRFEAEGLVDGAVVILTSDHGQRLSERHFLPGRPGHAGNPAFQEMLRIPLIVAPAVFGAAPGPVRTQDLFAWVGGLGGAPPPPPGELEEGELFLTEPEWQTYQLGRWKSYRRRGDGRRFLVDLGNDAGERRDVADRHPEVAEAHARRMAELTHRLAAPRARPGELDAEDEALLRAQGYVE